MLREFLPVQLIYQGKTDPKFCFPLDWHSPNHWSNESTMLGYINHIIVSYLQEYVGEDKTALVIINNFKGQVTESVIQLLEDHNVHVCTKQPMDISVNRLPQGSFWWVVLTRSYEATRWKRLGGLGGYSHTTNWWKKFQLNGSLNVLVTIHNWSAGITGAFDRNLDDVQEQESDCGNESSQEDLSSDEH